MDSARGWGINTHTCIKTGFIKCHYPKLYNMTLVLALNVFLLPKGLTFFLFKRCDTEYKMFVIYNIAHFGLFLSCLTPV